MQVPWISLSYIIPGEIMQCDLPALSIFDWFDELMNLVVPVTFALIYNLSQKN